MSTAPAGAGVGRTVLVTGATSGIGWYAARDLAAAGARVLLGARDAGRGLRAAEAVRARVPGADVAVVGLDLADLRSVVRGAAEVADAGPLHAVLANAGVTGTDGRRTSAQGHELMLATNHLGHAALVGLLLPALVDGGRGSTDAGHGPARVVGAGSIAHRFVRPPEDEDGWQSRSDFASFRAYCRSKLAVLLHTAELDRRLRAEDLPVRALAFSPGFAVDLLDTDDPQPLARGGPPGPLVRRLLGPGARLLRRADLLQGKADGALPAVAAVLGASATRPSEGAAAAHVGPRGPAALAGPPALLPTATTVADQVAAQRLWSLTEALVRPVTGAGPGPADAPAGSVGP